MAISPPEGGEEQDGVVGMGYRREREPEESQFRHLRQRRSARDLVRDAVAGCRA